MEGKHETFSPSTFRDGAPVLVTSRGCSGRERRFLLWVELNFDDERDFSTWMNLHPDEDAEDKEKLEEWLDHFFPNVARASRVITLEEALRMSSERTYADAGKHLGKE
jgi:hypothetical protein